MGLLSWLRERYDQPRPLSPYFEIGFHGYRYLIELISTCLKQAEKFIETGANVGSTLVYVAKQHPDLPCYSCEPDVKAYGFAQQRLAGFGNVTLANRMSPDHLRHLLVENPEIAKVDTVFWLDAHGYGYQWPPKDEVELITRAFDKGYIFVDDFKVPARPEFRWDEYKGQMCSFDFIADAIASDFSYRLYYPTYSDRTSEHHALTGWG